MHTHYSGVEFGPAYLGAPARPPRAIAAANSNSWSPRATPSMHSHSLGPRLLLAGLVDASGPTGFGAVFADTPEQARAVVARYKAAGFEQIKLYTLLKPDVIAALAAEAHRVGMTVTGHVPPRSMPFKASRPAWTRSTI